LRQNLAMQEKESALNKFILVFSEVEDPRIDRKKVYSLIEILFLLTSALMSDCDTWEDICEFGEMKLKWLRKYLPYTNGIPSHDTINRVTRLINPKLLEQAFIDWSTMSIQVKNGTVISFDGKRLCGSAGKTEQQIAHKQGGKSAKHVLHAWCNSLSVCLGQIEVDTKTNEITAIPPMLDVLDSACVLKGTVITIDAIGCQKDITTKIVDMGADFVIGLKGNQPKLRSEIESVFERTRGEILSELSVTTSEKGHNRKEERTCTVIGASELSQQIRVEWPAIQSIVQIMSIRKCNGKDDELETRYYVSSLQCEAMRMQEIIRAHWGIENRLHWHLDFTFGEDDSKKQAQNAAVNFSSMIKVAINLINSVEGKKRSMRGKRKMCALSDEYREKCFGF
jgi:predicted transposase YbfD/YdcC